MESAIKKCNIIALVLIFVSAIVRIGIHMVFMYSFYFTGSVPIVLYCLSGLLNTLCTPCFSLGLTAVISLILFRNNRNMKKKGIILLIVYVALHSIFTVLSVLLNALTNQFIVQQQQIINYSIASQIINFADVFSGIATMLLLFAAVMGICQGKFDLLSCHNASQNKSSLIINISSVAFYFLTAMIVNCFMILSFSSNLNGDVIMAYLIPLFINSFLFILLGGLSFLFCYVQKNSVSLGILWIFLALIGLKIVPAIATMILSSIGLNISSVILALSNSAYSAGDMLMKQNYCTMFSSFFSWVSSIGLICGAGLIFVDYYFEQDKRWLDDLPEDNFDYGE